MNKTQTQKNEALKSSKSPRWFLVIDAVSECIKNFILADLITELLF